jgi:hypothetical protein
MLPTGAGAAQADPWAGPALSGQLRPCQGPPEMCFRPARSALRAEECPGGSQSLQCRDEGAGQVIQRSLSRSNLLAGKNALYS